MTIYFSINKRKYLAKKFILYDSDLKLIALTS